MSKERIAEVASRPRLRVGEEAKDRLRDERETQPVDKIERAIAEAYESDATAILEYRKDPEIENRARFVLTISVNRPVKEILEREGAFKDKLRLSLDKSFLDKLCTTYNFLS